MTLARRPDAASRQAARTAPQAEVQKLIVSDDGVSLLLSKNRCVTVRYQDCEAIATWDDGSRALFGRDGFLIRFKPWEWVHGARIRDHIDGHVPSERRVAMGAGDGPAPAQDPGTMRPGIRRFAWGFWALLSVLLSVLPFVPPQPMDLDCGDRSAIGIVIGDVDAGVAGNPFVARKCRDEAMVMTKAGGLAQVSTLVAGAVGFRWARRRWSTR